MFWKPHQSQCQAGSNENTSTVFSLETPGTSTQLWASVTRWNAPNARLQGRSVNCNTEKPEREDSGTGDTFKTQYQFLAGPHGSSHKNQNQTETTSCFSTELTGLYEFHSYRPAHTTLFFTFQAICPSPLHSLCSPSRQQCLPEICKPLAHAGRSLPAPQLPNLSLRGPCLEVQPLLWWKVRVPRASDS